ncbi:MAG: cation diffusion facilitator family transporter [Rickettsiales bacterium]|jgi:cation diffusion facilitator family transporter|nr:cation diffusion facilitator family transporter [Rickettsiales bacterium]
MTNQALKIKSLLVLAISLATMAAEIYFGFITNSMALTADGFHMGAHAIVMGITFAVSVLASKREEKADRINAAGGKINAVFLLFSALAIIFESIERIFEPAEISFSEAILVSVVGLAVNAVCLGVMHDGGGRHKCEIHRHNLNYRSAYAHILSDAMTSVLAIVALVAGKYFGLAFLDSVMGIVGGLIILKWSTGLLSAASKHDDSRCSCFD